MSGLELGFEPFIKMSTECGVKVMDSENKVEKEITETDEEFSLRVKAEARERLRKNSPPFNIETVNTAMSLSEGYSYLGDLNQKPVSDD